MIEFIRSIRIGNKVLQKRKQKEKLPWMHGDFYRIKWRKIMKKKQGKKIVTVTENILPSQRDHPRYSSVPLRPSYEGNGHRPLYNPDRKIIELVCLWMQNTSWIHTAIMEYTTVSLTSWKYRKCIFQCPWSIVVPGNLSFIHLQFDFYVLCKTDQLPGECSLVESIEDLRPLE